MNSAQKRAQEIRRRYRFKHPSDIERILKAENIKVVRFPLRGRVEEIIVHNYVGIPFSLDRQSRQTYELLAHALGHYLLHAGNQPFDHLLHRRVVARQWERQAWDFAYELLMPADALLDLSRGSWNAVDLQEQFEVSEEFFQQRMEAFTEARAQHRGRSGCETEEK